MGPLSTAMRFAKGDSTHRALVCVLLTEVSNEFCQYMTCKSCFYSKVPLGAWSLHFSLFTLIILADSSYRTFYSSREPPTVTELGQPVYVDVFVLKHEDKDLTLLLQDCWATPTENPHDRQRWSLLVRGWIHVNGGSWLKFWYKLSYFCVPPRCPFVGDNHRTVVLPVVSSKELKYPSLHKWFVVKLFSFVKPPTLENLVYERYL